MRTLMSLSVTPSRQSANCDVWARGRVAKGAEGWHRHHVGRWLMEKQDERARAGSLPMIPSDRGVSYLKRVCLMPRRHRFIAISASMVRRRGGAPPRSRRKVSAKAATFKPFGERTSRHQFRFNKRWLLKGGKGTSRGQRWLVEAVRRIDRHRRKPRTLRMPAALPKASLRTAAEEEAAAAEEAAALLALRHASATVLARAWRARPRWPPDYALEQLYDARLSPDVGYDVSRWCRFEAGVFDEPSLAYVLLQLLRCHTSSVFTSAATTAIHP